MWFFGGKLTFPSGYILEYFSDGLNQYDLEK